MKIVDSVGWIAYFAGEPLGALYRNHLSRPSLLLTPSIIVYEVYKCVLREVGRDAAFLATAQLHKTSIVPLDDFLALKAAEASLQHGLPMADAIVYATALSHEATVVTSDAHFNGLPAVEFIQRSTP